MEKKKKPSEIRFEKEAKALQRNLEKTSAAATGTRKTEKQGREDQWTRLKLRAADS